MVISMQLDKKNFEKYAFDNYRNAIADKTEFKEDLRKAQHARKLATKIVNGKDVNIRLLVNHVILFFNVFAPTRFDCQKLNTSFLEINPFLGYGGPIFSGPDSFLEKALEEYRLC